MKNLKNIYIHTCTIMMNNKDIIEIVIDSINHNFDGYSDYILTQYTFTHKLVIKILSNKYKVRLLLPSIVDTLVIYSVQPNTKIEIMNESNIFVRKYFDYCVDLDRSRIAILSNEYNVWSCMNSKCTIFSSILNDISIHIPFYITELLIIIDSNQPITIPKHIIHTRVKNKCN